MRDTDSSLLVRIAHLYYNEDLKQSDIAGRLKISRQSVGRALQLAKARKIVQIKISSPLPTATDLEDALVARFGLKEAVVCKPVSNSMDSLREAVGTVAAEYLIRNVRDGQILGVSWGHTMSRCVSEMPRLDLKRVAVVQLDGSSDETSFSSSAEYIVHRLADALDAEPYTLPAPLIVDSRKSKERFVRDSRIARTLAMIERADFAMVCVGDVSAASNLCKKGYIDKALLSRLLAAGAVGDICGHFYDINGRICLPSLSARTIGIDLPSLKSKETSIAVVCGTAKTTAIIGELNGRFCNVLITDESTAREVIKKSVS
jgi:deoxyribonucleoside regulator